MNLLTEDSVNKQISLFSEQTWTQIRLETWLLPDSQQADSGHYTEMLGATPARLCFPTYATR